MQDMKMSSKCSIWKYISTVIVSAELFTQEWIDSFSLEIPTIPHKTPTQGIFMIMTSASFMSISTEIENTGYIVNHGFNTDGIQLTSALCDYIYKTILLANVIIGPGNDLTPMWHQAESPQTFWHISTDQWKHFKIPNKRPCLAL